AGTIRHALVVASDADPGRGLARGFPFAAAGSAVVCGWRDGPAGIAAFRFAPAAAQGGGDPDGALPEGLRATVAFERRRNVLTIREAAGFDAAAGALAGEVAAGLLADAGVGASDLDLVVANPLTAGFLDAL